MSLLALQYRMNIEIMLKINVKIAEYFKGQLEGRSLENQYLQDSS